MFSPHTGQPNHPTTQKHIGSSTPLGTILWATGRGGVYNPFSPLQRFLSRLKHKPVPFHKRHLHVDSASNYPLQESPDRCSSQPRNSAMASLFSWMFPYCADIKFAQERDGWDQCTPTSPFFRSSIPFRNWLASRLLRPSPVLTLPQIPPQLLSLQPTVRTW